MYDYEEGVTLCVSGRREGRKVVHTRWGKMGGMIVSKKKKRGRC